MISFIPADNENAASSRIRVYTLHKALTNKDRASCIGFCSSADAIFVQKRVSRKILAFVEKAKRKGNIVLYDIDDVGSALDYWAPPELFNKMLSFADVVTTDTCVHRDFIKNNYSAKCIEIIPDSIDYYPVSQVRLPLKDVKPIRVLWFGSLSNIALFKKYSSLLTAIPDVEVVAVTGRSASELTRLSSTYPKVCFMPWYRSKFISVLQSCHLTCLMHDGTDIDRAKSNNKMITSIAWGVPSIVSSTPEYERTATDSGIHDAVFKNDAELIEIIEKLRLATARNEYLNRSQEYIWKQYSPNAVSEIFLNIVDKHMKEKQGKVSVAAEPKTMSAFIAKLSSAINFIAWKR